MIKLFYHPYSSSGITVLGRPLASSKIACLSGFQFQKLLNRTQFLRGGVVSPTPKPGGLGHLFLSESSPLTCPAREALPVATLPPAQFSRSFGHTNPHRYVKLGIPSGGLKLLGKGEIIMSVIMYNILIFAGASGRAVRLGSAAAPLLELRIRFPPGV